MKERFSFSLKTGFFECLFKGKITDENLREIQKGIIGSWERKREFNLVLERLLLEGSLPAVWQNPQEKDRVFKSLVET